MKKKNYTQYLLREEEVVSIQLTHGLDTGLRDDNYYTDEMNNKYFSVSQYKHFCRCEASAMAHYKYPKSEALLVGSYIDSYYEGTLDKFKEENPEIFLKNGGLKAAYRHAEKIIERCEADEMFTKFMSGEKQVIKTGEIEGVPFKIKMDSYHPGEMIVDLKVMKSFKPINGIPVPEYWNYTLQAAVYQYIEGNNLPFYLAMVTKDDIPDIAIVEIHQEDMDLELDNLRKRIRHFQDIKEGKVKPERCGVCAYCRQTKVLTTPIFPEELGLSRTEIKLMRGEIL